MTTPRISDQTTEESNYVPFWSLMLIALIFFVVTAKPAGYCKAEKRVISDDEICIKLLDDSIKFGLVKVQSNAVNGEAYFLNNRSSCIVDKSAMARFRKYGLFDALFSDTIFASVRYEMSNDFKQSRSVLGRAIYSDILDLGPCIKVRETSGMIN